MGDNCINYEGSRYLCQALKVNKSLIDLNLKLNRIDDKAGQKMCIDLRVKESRLETLNLAANLLGNMFCESLSEYISYNPYIKRLDISSNAIEESNAATLTGSLRSNERIVQFDVQRNGFSPSTEEEIKEIVTKNFLKGQNIRYNRLGDNVGRVVGTEDELVGQVSHPERILQFLPICFVCAGLGNTGSGFTRESDGSSGPVRNETALCTVKGSFVCICSARSNCTSRIQTSHGVLGFWGDRKSVV